MPGARRTDKRGGAATASKGSKVKAVKKVSFEDFFSAQYGTRWPALKESMSHGSKEKKVAMLNRFAKCDTAEVFHGLEPVKSRHLRLYENPKEGGLLPPPVRGMNGVMSYYILDYASAMVVEQLNVEATSKVMDICAAPGGKSVGVAQFLFLQGGGQLTANEMNPTRNARLKRTLEEHFPKDESVKYEVLQRDGTRLNFPEFYDRLLLDAPCSSERHLLSDQSGAFDIKTQWSPAYTEKMATTQQSLFLAAIEMLRIGGVMTYSTCSISARENDEVVRYVLDHTRCGVELVPTDLGIGESTELGWIVLPDQCDGAGPMYCTTVRKTASMRSFDSSTDEDDSSSDDE